MVEKISDIPQKNTTLKGSLTNAKAEIIKFETTWFSPEELVKDKSKNTMLKISDNTKVKIGNSLKMSKSKKNVIDPIDIIDQYGADTARWFVMSDSPPDRDVEWTTSGIEASWKHLNRVWRIATEIINNEKNKCSDLNEEIKKENQNLIKKMNMIIRDVTESIENFAFNISIAKIYEFTNFLLKSQANNKTKIQALEALVIMMQPITPHFSEEIWSLLGKKSLISKTPWPKVDKKILIENDVVLPIQIDGKRRSEIKISVDKKVNEIQQIVLKDKSLKKFLKDKTIKKIIVVPGKIINVVSK